MSCSNCYNGCTEIVSDKCVKYTGIDVPILGIQNGDSLSYVEQTLIEFLTSTLDGTGIKPVIDPEIICTLVHDNLPTCGDITLVDLINALIKSTCFIEEQVTALEAKFAELEQGYQIDCLSGSPDATNTYEVLQATIVKVCELAGDLTALALDLDTNYVKLADLNALIQAYLDSQSSSNQQYLKMVPYTVVEYYGPLSNFDSSGAGIAGLGWDKIYLCNGANGTPDKRGRSPIGAIQGIPGGIPLSPVVDPASGNFNYSLLSTNGANTVTLSATQIPPHSHTASVTVNDPGHFHYMFNTDYANSGTPGVGAGTFVTARRDISDGLSYWMASANTVPFAGKTSGGSQLNITGISVGVTNQSTGGGQSHNNVHPVLACYYIMYIP